MKHLYVSMTVKYDVVQTQSFVQVKGSFQVISSVDYEDSSKVNMKVNVKSFFRKIKLKKTKYKKLLLMTSYLKSFVYHVGFQDNCLNLTILFIKTRSTKVSVLARSFVIEMGTA